MKFIDIPVIVINQKQIFHKDPNYVWPNFDTSSSLSSPSTTSSPGTRFWTHLNNWFEWLLKGMGKIWVIGVIGLRTREDRRGKVEFVMKGQDAMEKTDFTHLNRFNYLTNWFSMNQFILLVKHKWIDSKTKIYAQR